ncbi:MAG: cohesin domain-containing protein, partial [Acutalibacteraceae bacterium]|nr:cohesin domain-containing protein [Acutalibacteraceae bacterium]
ETTVLPRTSEPDVNADGIVTIQDVIAVLNALQPFSIQVGKTAAKPGTKVTVPIRIYSDKGTAGGQVYVSYNTKLTPISVKSGDAYTMNFTSDSNGYPITISWTTTNGKNQIAPNGSILAYLEFETDSNIKTTEYLDIEIVNQAGTGYLTSFEDSSGFSYTASYKSGYITVVP